ncbi:MAG: hypothetical protein NZ929_02870 [Aigarchaeota archaeon]|nr:hypothetical protein [Aigarchaeota archaeon]MCX8192338.1 hypothetical protein [Nitrososphaeria archaeon]MDW7986862.1 hypothetical protein [Nitrososphaerota archaeon]
MANFQVIFSGNEDELYKFVITWKMLTDLKKYEEKKKEIEELEERIRDLREEISKLDDARRTLQKEVNDLMVRREALKRELMGQHTTDIKLNP